MRWSLIIFVISPGSLLLNVQIIRFILPPAIFFPSVAQCNRINSFAGPFIAYVDIFYGCEPSGTSLPWKAYIRFSHFNPRKPRELQTVTGNITAKDFSFDDKTWMNVVVDKRSNNAWKENAFVFYFKNKGCSTFKRHFPGFWNVFYEEKMRGKTSCSIGPGVYAVNQKPIDWNFPDVPIMPYGHYKMRFSFGVEQRMYKCQAIEFFVIPKS